MKKLLLGLLITLIKAREDCIKDLNILYDKEMDNQAELFYRKITGKGNDVFRIF